MVGDDGRIDRNLRQTGSINGNAGHPAKFEVKSCLYMVKPIENVYIAYVKFNFSSASFYQTAFIILGTQTTFQRKIHFMMDILGTSRASPVNTLPLLRKHVGRCVSNTHSVGFLHLLVLHDSPEEVMLDAFPQIYLTAEWFSASEFQVGEQVLMENTHGHHKSLCFPLC